MATNGNSARKWLEENRQQVTETRVLQIRNNLEKKINELPESDKSDIDGLSEEHQGLLEALDVMEAFLQEQSSDRAATDGPVNIDASPLASVPSDPIPQLDDAEKKRRFQQLLKTGKV